MFKEPKKWDEVELEVPSLGTLTGICFDKGTTQYLSVPYASVPGRFRRPSPSAAPWPEKKWDGTKLSPFPCQPPRDFYPIPNPERPWVENPSRMSSTDCLSLNISVPTPPRSGENPEGGYPVMIFFHGGAFVYAAGGAAIYDGRVLSTVSKEDFNIPTIVISVNFRLGVFGFLASEEIRDYNKEFDEDGVGNYGLWDQVEALRWTKKHIAAFGGNPDRVCVFGQSAGGVSANVHLARNEPLFSSAIIQSGLIPLCGIMTVPQYQVLYDKMLTQLNIPEDLPPRQRLQRLIDAPEEDLAAAMVPVFVTPVITISPCDDGVLIGGPMPKYSEYVNFKAPEWCPRIMIGDVKNECMIWNKAYRQQTASSLLSLIRSFPFRTPGGAEKLIEAYGLKENMSNNETFWKIEEMCTHGLYSAVDWIVVRANPNVYAYHFDVPSPFENDWGGLAHHSLDNVYIWGLLRHMLPPQQQKVSADLAQAWLKFANGREPWAPFSKNGTWAVWTNTKLEERTIEQDKDRGYAIWEELEAFGKEKGIGLALIDDFYDLCDDLCMRRRQLTDPRSEIKPLKVGELGEYGIRRKSHKIAWANVP
ncbi:Alpha/Beta hydrolase protein [Lophiotrema nucula]|uniref:Carboxylic ester hydrolase n=1 Tax=Lophiotrema nucula TaxID=690887 RepID=A0A6A5Z7J2_9PLEO|nr:Alpha/Beta hydrolase protein [Lophiotrema nucula]